MISYSFKCILVDLRSLNEASSGVKIPSKTTGSVVKAEPSGIENSFEDTPWRDDSMSLELLVKFRQDISSNTKPLLLAACSAF
jgi:hypothetical protein